MKSMPASSARRASLRQSGQLPDQRSGTLVAERLDEQLAPKSPILSSLALYIAMRSRIDAVAGNVFSTLPVMPAKAGIHVFYGARKKKDVDGRDKPGHDEPKACTAPAPSTPPPRTSRRRSRPGSPCP